MKLRRRWYDWLLFGLALPCYLNATLLNGVFRKLDENAPPEDGACE